jgi:glycerate kinase
MEAALGGTVRTTSVGDPLGRQVAAHWLLAPGGVAYIEAAQANGLFYLLPDSLAPLEASTHGVGELLLAAAVEGARRMIVGVGGSATTDGGLGMAQALGAILEFEPRWTLVRGGGSLPGLRSITWRQPDLLAHVEVTVATDVTNPLLGPNGAAAIFGPQKGASDADVELLERGLTNFAGVIERDLRIDIRTVAGGGAAGGLAAGLYAFLGAEIRSGFDMVADATQFERRLGEADLVVTGEGSFDSQSRQGKTTGHVIDAAEAAGVGWLVLAGVAEEESERVRSLKTFAGDERDPMKDAADVLEDLAADAVAAFL